MSRLSGNDGATWDIRRNYDGYGEVEGRCWLINVYEKSMGHHVCKLVPVTSAGWGTFSWSCNMKVWSYCNWRVVENIVTG